MREFRLVQLNELIGLNFPLAESLSSIINIIFSKSHWRRKIDEMSRLQWNENDDNNNHDREAKRDKTRSIAENNDYDLK
jgi:hypothetical protein